MSPPSGSRDSGRVIPPLLLTLLLCSCVPIAGDGWSGPAPPPPGQEANQDLALRIVWADHYGQQWDGLNPHQPTPPPILWHYNDSCDHSMPAPGYPNNAFWDSSFQYLGFGPGICLVGEYNSIVLETTTFEATDRIDVEWDGTMSANAALAHELCHAYRQYIYGDLDRDHDSDCFSFGGVHYDNDSGDEAPGSMVHEANQNLINAGL